MQATVGSHCLDCAKASRPDVATRVKYAQSRVMAPFTTAMIAVNVLVFVLMVAADSQTASNKVTEWHVRLGLARPLLERGFDFGTFSTSPHEWYRLVTAGFIHFGLLHLAMNMWFLYQVGNMLERAIGSARLAAVYFASLLAGSFAVILIDEAGVSGGASGALFGLLTCAAVGMHRRGINIMSTGIGTTLLINLVLTFTINGISIGGHVGGAIGGAICGWVMLAPGWRPQPKWAGWAVAAAVAAVSVVGSVLIVTSA